MLYTHYVYIVSLHSMYTMYYESPKSLDQTDISPANQFFPREFRNILCILCICFPRPFPTCVREKERERESVCARGMRV